MADDPISHLELVKVEIDKIFGRGFSRDHPDFTSAVMLSAAMDCLVGYIRTFARPLIEELIGTAWPDRTADPAMIDGSKITPTIHALLRDLRRIEFARGGRSRLTSPEEVRERTRERVRRFRPLQQG